MQNKTAANSALSFLLAIMLAACGPSVAPFSVGHVDRAASDSSRHPVAIDVSAVGTYPGPTKSGAGYFYDEVLEYRVWLHPERGAEPLAGDKDYFAAFAQYERAAAFAGSKRGAEEPLVLVRQLEWLDEPVPGRYVHMKGQRITEWRVDWLASSKRSPNSISEFLRNPRRAASE